MQNLALSIDKSLDVIFRNIILYIPNILLAFVILAVGMWIGKVVSKMIGDLLRIARIDFLFSKIGVTQLFHEIGFRVSVAYAVQVTFKWLLYAVTLMSVANILGLNVVTDFIDLSLFGLLPKLTAFTLTLFVTFVVANKVKDFVAHSTYVASHHSPAIASVTWLLVVTLGVLTAINELEIAKFLTDVLAGFIQALGLGVALALGLSFGLGCKEEARCLARKWMGKECYDLDCGCNTFGCEKCSDFEDGEMGHEDGCECSTCDIK